MSPLKLIVGWVKKIGEIIKDILAPENKNVAKLLELEEGAMRLLLPKSPVNMNSVYVLFDYGNMAVKLIIKHIKYKNNASLKKRIAKYLYEEIIDISEDIALFTGSPPLVVPMPMSKNEKNKKGFNQCEELLKEVDKMADGNIKISYTTLKKIRETERQTNLSKEERLLNVKESMIADGSAVGNHSVIVLDDVYTTLASFSEARRALIASGVHHVIGLFIAH